MWAAAPVVLAGAQVPPLETFAAMPQKDRYWAYAQAFMRANAPRYQHLFVLARLAMIPISCFGLWIAYRWSKELYGSTAALASAALYALCPNLLAHGSLVGTDVGITVAILASAYFWWRFCVCGKWTNLLAATIAIGVAHLCKFNAVLIWPILIVIGITTIATQRATSRRRIALGLLIASAGALFIFNLGYLFEGTGRRAGSYALQSSAVSGIVRRLPTWLPMPLPEQAILGFDALKWEVEQKFQGFLLGRQYVGSRWYYFPVALALKLPMATLTLLAAAFACARTNGRWSSRCSHSRWA
jgi:4-amino-4-deoxy-L-arabinose transferase-like glycosyltransferase